MSRKPWKNKKTTLSSFNKEAGDEFDKGLERLRSSCCVPVSLQERGVKDGVAWAEIWIINYAGFIMYSATQRKWAETHNMLLSADSDWFRHDTIQQAVTAYMTRTGIRPKFREPHLPLDLFEALKDGDPVAQQHLEKTLSEHQRRCSYCGKPVSDGELFCSKACKDNYDNALSEWER